MNVQGVDLINDQTKRLVSLGIWTNLLPVCEPLLPYFVNCMLMRSTDRLLSIQALYFMPLLAVYFVRKICLWECMFCCLCQL